MWMWQSVIKFVVSSPPRIHNALRFPTQRPATFQCSFTEDITPARKELGTTLPRVRNSGITYVTGEGGIKEQRSRDHASRQGSTKQGPSTQASSTQGPHSTRPSRAPDLCRQRSHQPGSYRTS